MAKACSQCGSMGHRSRMCLRNNNSTSVSPGFKLFGVKLDTSIAATSSLKRSSGVGYFSPSSSLSSGAFSNVSLCSDSTKLSAAYLSDDLNGHPQNRKKGLSWTEEEHRKFLSGLEKLGKGDWRGISKHFVPSRTPTQVASHAQKYFIRQNKLNKKQEGPSLFKLKTRVTGKGICSNDPRNKHECMVDISESIWLTYANRYYSDAICGKPSYLQSPMSNLLMASWRLYSYGMFTYPNRRNKSNNLKPTIKEAEPNLDLTLAAPKQNESKS